MELENSTMQEMQSGEQAEVVAPQQSPDGEGQEGVVDLPTEDADGLGLADVGEDGADTEDPVPARPDGAGRAGEAKREPPAQSAEENAAYRAMRLRAQREAEASARASLDAEIASLGIADPYNEGRTLSNLSELRAYSERFRRAKIEAEAKRTGRSVSELEEDAANRAFLSSLRRSAERQSTEQGAAREKQAFIEADVMDFVRQYPEMNAERLSALENNAQFRRFCGSRFGREPLAKLYGDYCAFVGDAGTAAVAKASGRSARSTGGGTGGGSVLSPTQRAELAKWNRENPSMAMTAKEYLGR